MDATRKIYRCYVSFCLAIAVAIGNANVIIIHDENYKLKRPMTIQRGAHGSKNATNKSSVSTTLIELKALTFDLNSAKLLMIRQLQMIQSVSSLS